MNPASRIYVAGHRGLVGSAILRNLQARGYANFVLRTHAELELERQADVQTFFETERPEYVFLAAAKVGGIHANNTYPADFIYNNLRPPCSPANWSRPTSPTRSPRSPASSSVRATTASTAPTSSR